MDCKEINFALTNLSIDQFATIFEPVSDKNVEFSLIQKFRADYERRMIRLGIQVQFSESAKVFMQIEISCLFLIKEEDWLELSDNGTSAVVLDKKFVAQLTAISIGTLRGTMLAKTENTPYSKYFLPLVDATRLCKEDFRIEMSSKAR
jgi:hypothetical protein